MRAARAMGARTWRILMRAILPNAASSLIVQATLGVAGVILEVAALGYLGFGRLTAGGRVGRDAL